MATVTHPFALLSLLSLLLLPIGVRAACYYPDGTLAPNDSPCQDSSANSACCGLGYACLTNGICQATGDELQKPGATEFVRGSCTDKAWRSSSCPLFCINPGVDNVGGGEGVAKCSNTSQDVYFCINVQNINGTNCDTGKNILFFPGTPSAITTIGVTPTSTTTSHSSQSSTWTTTTSSTASTTDVITVTSSTPSPGTTEAAASPAPTTATQPSAPDPTRVAIIGGSVGGFVGGVAIVGLVVWLIQRKRKQREAPQPHVAAQPVGLWGGNGDGMVHEAPGWAECKRETLYRNPHGLPHPVYEAP